MAIPSRHLALTSLSEEVRLVMIMMRRQLDDFEGQHLFRNASTLRLYRVTRQLPYLAMVSEPTVVVLSQLEPGSASLTNDRVRACRSAYPMHVAPPQTNA